ncbi:MAG: hypothetical protein WCY62_09130 [Clostridia bacterium]
MDGFDDFGKRLKEAGRKVFKETKEFTDTTKLNIKMKGLDIDLEDLYRDAGKKAYAGENTSELFAAIGNKLAEIEACKAELAEAKGMKICPNCKAEMPKEAVACMKCGNKFEA